MELRVFISSTCEDLGQVRADLSEACRRAGWIPVLCEEGSVTYEREVEDSCYDEVQNCPVLISIIGRRWGTPSVHDRNISISQGEFNAAMAKKKKVYVFIKPDVFYEYKTYSKNRDNPRYTPCSVDDIRTFSFIEDIYNSKDENVVINPFLSVSKIMDYLKKQFGGIVENALEHKSEKVELKSNSLWPHNMKIFTGLYDKIGNVEIKQQIVDAIKDLEEPIGNDKGFFVDIYEVQLESKEIDVNILKIRGERYLKTLCSNYEEKETVASIKENGEYKGQTTYAFIKNRNMWIVDKSKGLLDKRQNPNVCYKDLLSETQDYDVIPEFWVMESLDEDIHTSVIYQLRIPGNNIKSNFGFISFNSNEYHSCYKGYEEKLEKIANLVAQDYMENLLCKNKDK